MHPGHALSLKQHLHSAFLQSLTSNKPVVPGLQSAKKPGREYKGVSCPTSFKQWDGYVGETNKQSWLNVRVFEREIGG